MFQLIANSRTLAIRNHYILAIETSPTVTGFHYSIAGFHMICWRREHSRSPPFLKPISGHPPIFHLWIQADRVSVPLAHLDVGRSTNVQPYISPPPSLFRHTLLLPPPPPRNEKLNETLRSP